MPVNFPESADLDPAVPPSGDGCATCTATQGWWVHLRRCTTCGTVGCCDSSPGQHATAHFHETGHPIVASYEPDEAWFWNYATEELGRGPVLAQPRFRPTAQPAPGPEGHVPDDWRELTQT